MKNLKVYILPVNALLQPKSQPFRYPSHNRDYGVEQDFLRYLAVHQELTTTGPEEADWHYLPVYWYRWHLSHNFAQTGLVELKQAVEKSILDDTKTFTICQYDGGPQIDLGKTALFMANPIENKGFCIPLLSTPHRKPLCKVSKKYLACFNGTLAHHPIRQEMMDNFKKRDDVVIGNSVFGPRFFVRLFTGEQYVQNIISSYVALCPRGSSAASFRFFEAMHLGTVPLMISDFDARPFKQFIDWDEMSFFARTVDELEQIINSLDTNRAILMGKKSFIFWKEHLNYQKWCKYVFRELELIT